jgi:DNA-binding transcriptional regulator YdaS (Cro superfamily)
MTEDAPTRGNDRAQDALQRAIDAVGTVTALAREVGVTPPAVHHWLSRRRVPHGRARDVSRVTGVPLAELRPDIWESPSRAEDLHEAA